MPAPHRAGATGRGACKGPHTRTAEIAAGSLTARAEAFGIEAHSVDGQDVLAVNRLASQLVERCRRGEGPFFIELATYRYHGHHVGDINRTYYRAKSEEEAWKTTRDPITNFGAYLAEQGIADADELIAINEEIRKEAEAAVAYALDAPYPDGREVTMHV